MADLPHGGNKFPGLDFVLYLGNGASSEDFDRVAGQRTTGFSINQESIDVTDKDDSRWKKLLGDKTGSAGVRSMSLTASGNLEDAASHKDLLEIFTTGAIRNYRVEFADGQFFEGPFLLTGFEGGGEYTAEQTYSITLESAGDMDYGIAT